LTSKVSATRARTPRRAAPGSGSTVARGCPWIPAANGTPSTSRAAPEHRRGGSARPGRAIMNDSAPSSPSPGRPVALPSRRNAGICHRTWPRPRAARQGGRGGPTRRLRFEFQELTLLAFDCQERELRNSAPAVLREISIHNFCLKPRTEESEDRLFSQLGVRDR